MLKEFVAGGRDPVLAGMRQVLTPFADDLSKLRGIDIYDKMLRDGGVESPFGTLCTSILSQGVHLMPAFKAKPGQPIDPQHDSDIQRSQELLDFTKRSLYEWDDKDFNFPMLCRELLDGLAFGHKIAEKVYRVQDGQMVLSRAVPRNSRYVAFVVDEHYRTLGMAAATPENGLASPSGIVTNADISQIEGLLPREKFIVHRTRMVDGDPRGLSSLMTAYNPWYIKNQIWPEYLRYLKQFATPIVVGKTPPDGGNPFKVDENGLVVLDSNGQPIYVRKESAMLDALLQILNSSVVVIPAGAEVQLYESKSDGGAFIDGNNFFDRQIALAILGTGQLTIEAKHESRSSKDSSMDVFDVRVAANRGYLAGTIDRDIIRPLIELNFGREALRHAPTASLMAPAVQDKPRLLAAYSQAKASGLVHDFHLPEIHEELGLTPIPQEILDQEREEDQMRARLAAGDLGKIRNPAGREIEELEDEE